jgi:type III restriction enzyme
MIGTKTFKTNELVLKIKKNSFDSTRYPLHEWERFIDILCENRDYQKESIKSCIIYLISDKYSTIEDVVEENFNKNDTLREKFNTIDNYKKKIQLPSRKSGCIDLATGTGKSYVIYGIAQIALGLGIVDKVLVLGPPSTTIEKGLTDKFNMLSSKPELRNAIPESSYCKSVEIIDANRTITSNCICVENINAVYSKNTSSIHLRSGESSCLIIRTISNILSDSQELHT